MNKYVQRITWEGFIYDVKQSASMSNIDRMMVWRVLLSMNSYLYTYHRTVKDSPYYFETLRGCVTSLTTLAELLNDSEQNFVEWMTKSTNTSGWYDVKCYGIVWGRTHPECYANVYRNLAPILSNIEAFDYILDEYAVMKTAEVSALNIEERESRTCEKCDTRFETQDGMHRHRPRCKGIYRGDYHPKPVKDDDWDAGKTSSW
jgi:hypothetical protein